MKALQGTGVAIVTPFNEHLNIDNEALRRVVEHCIEGGVDYLVVLGTTGESVTLDRAEKKAVTKLVVEANMGRVPLVLGIGGNNTSRVTEELRSTDLEPFAAILSVSPYYNKPTQEGIYMHFKQLAGASSKPLILYNVPGRTASNILPETVLRLAEDCPNIVGIKEASGDMNQVKEIIRLTPAEFMVISGDDITALPTVLAGGHGVISVLAQGIPSAFSSMIALGRQGQSDRAFSLHHKMKTAMELIFEEGNPAGIKAMLEYQKICSAKVRLPLVEASPTLKKKIAEFVDQGLKMPA
ncbi:MAG: 4-hydroxy-tetrahydrodipicolinate synthase [Flavobacteriaceae bacterium]